MKTNVKFLYTLSVPVSGGTKNNEARSFCEWMKGPQPPWQCVSVLVGSGQKMGGLGGGLTFSLVWCAEAGNRITPAGGDAKQRRTD